MERNENSKVLYNKYLAIYVVFSNVSTLEEGSDHNLYILDSVRVLCFETEGVKTNIRL